MIVDINDAKTNEFQKILCLQWIVEIDKFFSDLNKETA